MNRWDTIYKTAYLPHQVSPRFNEQFFESFLNLKDQTTYNSFHFFFSMKINLSMSEVTQSKSAGFKPLVLTCYVNFWLRCCVLHNEYVKLNLGFVHKRNQENLRRLVVAIKECLSFHSAFFTGLFIFRMQRNALEVSIYHTTIINMRHVLPVVVVWSI